MIGIAVAGCGRWGPNHIRNFSGLPGCRVVACVDPDPERRKRAAALAPGVEAFSELSAVLSRPDVDAVVIATPTALHYEGVKQALLAGKHVLCEKPLCETAAQARELAALARKKKLVLLVGHVFLFNGGIIKIKELLDGGELGKTLYMSAVRTNLGPIRSDVNAAYDLAAHDVAVFNWLVGAAPKEVSATGAPFLQPKIEDVSFISLKYANGVYANVHASWLNPKKVRQMIVVGSKKMAAWDDMELSTPVAVYDKGAAYQDKKPYPEYGEFLRLSLWEGDVRLPKVELEEPLKAQDRAFVQAVQTGKLDRSGADFAVGVVETLEAAARSMKRGGAPEKVKA